jgi:hypothetical protein
MSLSRENLLELMALADGELEGEARTRAEALLAKDPEAQRALEALQAGAVGEWVARFAEDGAVKAGADSIADAVMANVAASRAPTKLDAARARRRNVAAVAALAVAMAAGVAAYVRSDKTPPGPVASDTTPTRSTAPTIPPSEGPTEIATNDTLNAAGRGVELEEVESLSAVSVFYVPAVAAPANANASSVVIWIDDTAPEPGGGGKP